MEVVFHINLNIKNMNKKVTIIDMEDFQKENDHSLKECYEDLISIMVDMSLLCGKALFGK